VFSTAIQANYYLLAVIGVWTSVLASVYYLRLIINMYARYPTIWKFHNPIKQERLNSANDFFNINVLFDSLNPLMLIDRPKSLILGWTTFFILFLLFFPTPLLLITHQAAILFLL
jgi:NADH:ubiquinone oxidoreductase subunit 2 (subunit N)